MLTPLNTTFVREAVKEKILGKMEKARVKVRETDKKIARKTLCSQDFSLSCVIVPLVVELLSLCCPAGHQRKNLVSKLLNTQ